MLIIADHRLPAEAQQKLAERGSFFAFRGNAAYEAIRSHPDVYLCAMPDNRLILAPNSPSELKNKLSEHKIHWLEGQKPVGEKYPQTARYNAVVSENFLIARPGISDGSLFEMCKEKKLLQVSQAYVRCNLMMLNKEKAICSDITISRALENEGVQVLDIVTEGIRLPGFSYGFIGGCMGIYKNEVWISGSLRHHPQGKEIRQFIRDAAFDAIELFDGRLLDIGGIFVLEVSR